MGVMLSPLICGIFMAVWEVTMREKGLGVEFIRFWKRYVDDIIIIWKGSREEFNEFFRKINLIHADIKFTQEVELPGQPLVALDVTLAFVEGKIVWRHFRKSTASDQVIHWRSAHDDNTKRSYVSGIVCTILRNCRYDVDAIPHLEDFRRRLLQAEWPGIVIEHNFSKGYARRDGIRRQRRGPLARNEYRTQLERAELKIIAKREDTARCVQRKTPELTQLPLPWNLDKELYCYVGRLCKKYKLPFRPYEAAGTKASFALCTVDFQPDKCDGCVVCQAKDHPDFRKPQCNLTHFVYILRCTVCGVEYVGETERPASVRLAEHLDTTAAARWLEQQQQQQQQPQRNRRPGNNGGNSQKGKGPSIFAQHICKDHPGHNAAACCAIGVVAMSRSYSHRKCTEGAFQFIYRCGLNLRVGGGQGIARTR